MDDATRAARAACRHGRCRARGRRLAGLWLVCAAFGPAGVSAQSALVSATAVRPGELVVRASIDAPTAPLASDFTLQVEPGGTVAASGIAPVALPAGSAALLICIDRSGSMKKPAIETMQKVFRRTLVPRQGESQLPVSVAIVEFGTGSLQLLDPTSDPARVAAVIDGLQLDRKREGKTVLYDAVVGGLATLRFSGATYKRLLIVSDGQDEGSSLSKKALLESAVLPPPIVIDAIGFGVLAKSASGSLATLAGATGGRFSLAQTPDALAEVLAQMIRQFLPRPQVDVRFDATPVVDARQLRSATLWFRPRDAAAVALPLDAAVLAGGPGSLAAPPPNPVDGSPDSPASPWRSALRFVVGLPIAVRIGAGLLALVLLAALGVALFRQRKTVEPSFAGGGPPEPTGGDPAAGPGTEAPMRADAVANRPRPTLVAHRWPAPGGGRTVAIVQGVSGAAEGQRLRITNGSVRIGAAPDNDLVLRHDDFVSGHHVVLKAEASGLYVVDLGSRNGSELNGVKFIDSTRSLSPGDRVTLGRSAFDVLSADPRAGPGGGGESRTA